MILAFDNQYDSVIENKFFDYRNITKALFAVKFT